MTDGEVRIREGNSVTAIETETLDEPISIDLDQPETPHIGVPGNVAVNYEGEFVEDADEDADDVAADGGYVTNRVSMRQYGLGLTGDARHAAFGVMALAYAAAGYLWNVEPVASLVTLAAAVFSTYVLMLRKHSGGDE